MQSAVRRGRGGGEKKKSSLFVTDRTKGGGRLADSDTDADWVRVARDKNLPSIPVLISKCTYTGTSTYSTSKHKIYLVVKNSAWFLNGQQREMDQNAKKAVKYFSFFENLQNFWQFYSPCPNICVFSWYAGSIFWSCQKIKGKNSAWFLYGQQREMDQKL